MLLCSCGKYSDFRTNNLEIDKIFKAWNIATSNSILLEVNSTRNEKQRLLYENRLSALKSYLEIENFKKVNNNSIRYKFLKKSIKNWNDKFYIIEANQSGEQVSIITYILIPNKNNTYKIIKYEYKNNEWIKIDEYLENIPFKYNRIKYSTTFGKGNNQNDVIITFIKNKRVISSDFFLFSTMKTLELK